MALLLLPSLKFYFLEFLISDELILHLLQILRALLNDFALFASTNAFMPLIKVPPIAAPACNIAITGTALFSLEPKCSCPFKHVAVASPFDV